jgi:hypothetical protein
VVPRAAASSFAACSTSSSRLTVVRMRSIVTHQTSGVKPLPGGAAFWRRDRSITSSSLHRRPRLRKISQSPRNRPQVVA